MSERSSFAHNERLTESEEGKSSTRSVQKTYFHDVVMTEGDDGSHVEDESRIVFPLRENQEIQFFEASCDEREIEVVEQMHQRVMNDPNLFVGQGNYATVYDLRVGNSYYCAKHIWRNVFLGVRGGDVNQVPGEFRPLAKVQEHLKQVSKKMHSRAVNYDSTETDFPTQNSYLVEAAMCNLASAVLEKNGFSHMVPVVEKTYIYRKNVEGKTEDGDPYMINDEADILIMERIDGYSIQDLILSPEIDQEIIDQIDIETFETKLNQAIECLHKNGILHGDITNRNIMINLKTFEPVIIDFGAARFSWANYMGEQDNELLSVHQVVRWLRRFKNNPDETRLNLLEKLAS